MKVPAIEFTPGLNTQTLEETTAFPVWQRFQNLRAGRVGAERRPGCQPITRIVSTSSIIDFDGVNDTVTCDYDARTIGAIKTRTSWSIEFLCQPTTLAAQRTILNHSTQLSIFQDSTSSGRVVATIKDAGGATLTLQVTGVAAASRVEGRLSRTGSLTWSLEVNGTAATGTAADVPETSTAAMHIGSTGAASNWYLGRIERVTMVAPYRTGRMSLCSREQRPYLPNVLFDFVTEVDANGYVLDRSRYGLHAAAVGSPATTTSLLAVNPMSVQAIGQTRGNSNANVVYVVAGGRVYPLTL